eukprot:c5863_g1_i1.p1 GENE.c5863_g1_i1~~c5863_g1_i1.p1  ORF type:complete len:210 (+),score=43.18 c5863_g1_i1:95-631(+)
MNIHHTRHHNAYVSNLNNLIAPYSDLQSVPIDALQSSIVHLPENIQTGVRNNGGGHFNHSMFWRVMAPPGSANVDPYGRLKQAIEEQFGSVDAMKGRFTDAAVKRFGSGWAWLCVNDKGQLFVTSTPNQDNPLMTGIVGDVGTPLLCLDVWEHAYYLQYQNKRADYINAFWKVVNWDQ